MKRAVSVIAGLTLASGMALAGDKMKDVKFENLDTNGDGMISQSEIAQGTDDVKIREHFAQADVDQNGYLNQQEYSDLQSKVKEYSEEAE